MRSPRILQCQNCTVDFDGATDAERFDVTFCPLHAAAPVLYAALKAHTDPAKLRHEVHTLTNAALAAAEGKAGAA